MCPPILGQCHLLRRQVFDRQEELVDDHHHTMSVDVAANTNSKTVENERQKPQQQQLPQVPPTVVETITTEEEDVQEVVEMESLSVDLPSSVTTSAMDPHTGNAQLLLQRLPYRSDIREATMLLAKCLDSHVAGAIAFERSQQVLRRFVATGNFPVQYPRT